MAKDKIQKAVDDACKTPMSSGDKADLITGAIGLAVAGGVFIYDKIKNRKKKNGKK